MYRQLSCRRTRVSTARSRRSTVLNRSAVLATNWLNPLQSIHLTPLPLTWLISHTTSFSSSPLTPHHTSSHTNHLPHNSHHTTHLTHTSTHKLIFHTTHHIHIHTQITLCNRHATNLLLLFSPSFSYTLVFLTHEATHVGLSGPLIFPGLFWFFLIFPDFFWF